MKYAIRCYFVIAFMLNSMVISNANAQSPDSLSQATAYALQKETVIIPKGTPVNKALDAIGNKFGISVMYRRDAVEDKSVLEAFSLPESFSKALSRVIKGYQLTFKHTSDKTYSVYRKEKLGFRNAGVHQQETVSGTVTDDSTGQTLPGVNIKVEGTTTGTSTNGKGHYSLQVPSLQDTLVFSYIGYRKRVVPISGRRTIDVGLISRAISGKEMVVVGYGSQKQKDVTGSITSVSGDQIHQQSVANVSQALQGQVAGVHITNNNWTPGSNSTIRIRGTRSLTAGNSPLVVVDGVIYPGSLSDINTSDISSVQVLKDASATAIYGARGANGVILVTTKKGKAGEAQISYNASVGIQSPDKLDLMNADQFVAMHKQGYAAIGEDTSLSNIFNPAQLAGVKNGTYTNWQSLAYRKAVQTNHEFSIRGGNEQTQFSIAPSFYDQQGVQRGQDYKRYSLRASINHEFTNKFKTGFSTIITKSFQNRGSGHTGYTTIRIPPIVPARDSTGGIIFNPAHDTDVTNPLDEVNNALDQHKRLRVMGQLFAQYNLTPWLSYRMNFGSNIQVDNGGTYYGSNTNYNTGGEATASTSEYYNFHYTWDNIVKINHTFNELHDIHATLLYSIESDRVENKNAAVRGLPYEHQLYYNLGSASDVTGVGSNLTAWKLQSFMGRINYSFKDTYLLTLTGREDGSSRLAPGHKYSFFPSVAVGWRLMNEPFMESLRETISQLKFRISYGATGNTAISPYETTGGLSRTQYNFGDNAAFGYQPGSLSNPNLKWERTKQFDIGLNTAFFDSRLTADFDFYRQTTNDILLTRNIPSSTGFSNILSNIGKTRNTGFDLSLSSVNIQSKNFEWSTNLNFSTNKNEIVKLYGTGANDVANNWFVGKPINVHYGYQFDGIWQTSQNEEAVKYDENPGEIRVVDQNDDGNITDADRMILGSPSPDWTGGISNTFNYKEIDFSFLITTVQGVTLYNHSLFYDNTLNARYNNIDVDYWTSSNPSNKWPRPNANRNHPLYYESQFYQNGSFIRVKNITLGYSLPVTLMQTWGIQSCRFYVKTQNPFLFTSDDFVGAYDPDGGTDYNSPSYKSYFFGIQLHF